MYRATWEEWAWDELGSEIQVTRSLFETSLADPENFTVKSSMPTLHPVPSRIYYIYMHEHVIYEGVVIVNGCYD